MRWSKKWAVLACATVAPLTLNGCLILPGEFTSEMTVRRSGDFSFAYKGQIQLVGLANILNSGMDQNNAADFKAVCWSEPADRNIEHPDDAATPAADIADLQPQVVYAITHGAATPPAKPAAKKIAEEAAADPLAKEADEEAAANAAWQMEERECTAEETATQKKEWDEQRAASKKRDDEARKMAAMMLGGIDPKDPKTIARFAKEVERLAAWHKVEHLGNGVFMIDYSTKGKLADDFAFPVIPRYAIGEPMIHITRWDDGRMRVEAPAFKTDPQLSVMSLLGAGSLMGMMGGPGSADKMPEPKAVNGTFTLTTDARIIANNTEEGPESVSGMDVLRWDIGAASDGAPMALLKLVE